MATSYAAYSVYYYESDPPYAGHGMAGRILDAGASFVVAYPGLQSGLNGDPKVEGFTDAGNALRLAVTDYVTGSAQPVYIYDPVTPANLATPTWTNVQNLYTLVRLGNYLYALDFDNARIVEINPASTPTGYAATGVTFTLPGSLVPTTPSGLTAHGQALAVIGGKLYGLFTFTDSAWANYGKSLLVRFDVTGGSSISIDSSNGNFAENAFSLADKGSEVYVAAIGGAQGSSGTPNANSRVQKISIAGALNTASVTDVLTQSDFAYEYRDISFDAGGNAYVLMGTYNSSWNLVGQLLKIANLATPGTHAVIDTFSTTPGYFWSAQYTADNNRIWFARGNAIRVYDASSFTTPAATLTLSVNGPGNLGGLLGSGDLYDNINDLTYIGATGTRASLRGYRSPLQVSNTPRAHAARALTRGRPELTEDELEQLDD
ncbi:hypothetical protein E6C76_21290 [Pseudothauera nasutitermitis]|uniref:Uncharacterized protein n=1 Tax=Pseudothauera nasutitermitis TaxID=2565930 RepID=A0A4S4APE5_9RHOO|nr:hypothetical protein [Pseudothauera nasutitermitis]THF61127.1 hypothetical protein E6C76_21290 [Pseudothauera nasutitermitis]